LQWAIVALAVLAAAWAAWRILRGRSVWRRGRPDADGSSCASCHAADRHAGVPRAHGQQRGH
jgi:cytochrome c553